MKENNIISFKKDDFTFERIKKYNVNLKKGFIQIDAGTFFTFIPEDIFNQHKSEFDSFYLLSDKIRFSAFNDYDTNIDIPEFCSQLKNRSLKKLKTFISNSTSNTDALRIIAKGIINQPLYLLEALQQYPDTLPENEKYYFRQKWINNKLEFAKDKFTGYKYKLESEIRELAATDPEKLKKLLKGIFLFTEDFICDLRQCQGEFKYLHSPLFNLYLNEIIYFKSYYLALIGEFHFPEINCYSTPATSSKPEPPGTIENNSEDIELIKPHPRIFPNGKCWQLFEYWKENAKDIKADICFAYWRMIKDRLMYEITPKQFGDWLNDELNFNLDGYWKQLHRLKKPDREKLYSMTKLQFQLNKSQY